MAERGIDVSHTTIMRWVHQYAPELDKKIRRKLKPTGDSLKLDETYIKIKGKYLNNRIECDHKRIRRYVYDKKRTNKRYKILFRSS